MIAPPDLPTLPGFHIRLFAGPADYPAIVAIHQQRAEADQIDPFSSYESLATAETVAADYADTFDPQHNTLIAEIDEAPVGCTAVAWWNEQDGTSVYLHEEHVVPRWRGQGLEQALLHWSEARLRQVAAAHPPNPKAVLGANATDAETQQQALLLRNGYQEVFAMLEMELARLEQPLAATMPAPFVVRNPQPGEYRQIWAALQQAYSGRAMFEALTDEQYQEFVDDPHRNPAMELVAWHGDEIAGMVFVRMDRGHGVIDECNVRPAYRRRGLARALMLHGLALLYNNGARMVRLHVRQHNETGAQQLYQTFGFRPLKAFRRYRKPLH